MNTWFATFMPGAFWDMAEAFLGLSLIIISFAQRTITPRFRSDISRCSVDRYMVYISQAGLVLLGVIGCIVLVDALLIQDRVPRAFAVLAMLAYLLIHGRVIVLAFLELWPLKYTRWHRQYGAAVYYANEYRLLGKKSVDP